MRPYLFLDVDGPINPYNLNRNKKHIYEFEKHYLHPATWTEEKPLPVFLSRDMGADLAALQDHFELVWATTWEHEANKHIAPLIGLPELPVVVWPAHAKSWTLYPRHLGSWKTRWLLEWVDEHGADRPWVFVDDELRRSDRTIVEDHYGGSGSFLLKAVPPTLGLRPRDVEELRDWAVALTL